MHTLKRFVRRFMPGPEKERPEVVTEPLPSIEPGPSIELPPSFQEIYEKNCCFPPGHYYSPITNIDEIKSMEDKVFHFFRKEVPGIDFNEEEQVQLLKAFTAYYKEMPFPENKQEGYRYFFINDVFSYTDAIILYSFLRHFKPQRVIEVGSGYSSSLMLDTNNTFFNNSMNLTFIEPYPEDRLDVLIREEDRASAKIIVDKVQNVKLDVFTQLQEGDILFIDGSHVSKAGSDLNFLVFEVLPILAKGVIIHFHDIFHPLEYSREWIYEGRNWNEIYLLKAFLTYNPRFKILFFNDFMHKYHSEGFAEMSDCYKNRGGSLWLRKL